MTHKDCIVLDFENGKTYLIGFDDTQEIEEILTENYELNLSQIEYMVVNKFILEKI